MYARQFVTLFGKRTLEQRVAALFAVGEQGIWYDPSDLLTMFQDSAGTNPVTALGDPVGKILDKSGRGNHATQATSASRPVLQQDGTGRYYLNFDGVDDFMVTPAMDFTATDKITLLAGVRKASDAATGYIFTLGANYVGSTGELAILLPYAGGVAEWRAFSKGSVLANAITTGAAAAPATFVGTVTTNIAGDSIVIRLNGVQRATSASDHGTGNYGNKVGYIGIYGGATAPFNGRIYSLIVRSAASNASQIASGEAYANIKTGAY